MFHWAPCVGLQRWRPGPEVLAKWPNILGLLKPQLQSAWSSSLTRAKLYTCRRIISRGSRAFTLGSLRPSPRGRASRYRVSSPRGRHGSLNSDACLFLDWKLETLNSQKPQAQILLCRITCGAYRMIDSGNGPKGRTRQTISSPGLMLQMGKPGFKEEGGIFLRSRSVFVPAPSSRILPCLASYRR